MNEMISIIVPVYNVSMYLEKCLDSLINQTYQNIEIITVDDGSTDNSGKICDEYANKYLHKVLAIHKSNQGVSSARNIGLESAKGEFIAFVDGDDWVEPEMFENLLKNLVQNHADISICSMKKDYDDKLDDIYKTTDIVKCNCKQLYREIIDNPNVYGYVCNKLFKKNLLENIRFDTTLTMCEDMDFTLRYIEKCTYGVCSISQLYHYRLRKGSETADLLFTTRKMSVIKAYEKIILFCRRVCPEYVYILLRNYLKININMLGRMKISGVENIEIEKNILENIQKTYRIVMKDKKNSLTIRCNIALSYRFPKGILKVKQGILKRKYRG